MKHFVYKTTNDLNGDYYYGVHSTYDMNDGYIGSGLRLKNAINKYGKSNFTRTIVQYFENRDDALIYEHKILTPDVLADPHCYNIAEGGYGGNTIAGLTSEQYKMFCDKAKESHNTKEYRDSMSEIKKQHWKRGDYQDCWKNRNVVYSQEKRDKISEQKKLYYIEHPELRRRLSENNPMKREEVRIKARHPHNMSEDGMLRLREGAKKRTGKNNGCYGSTFKWMNDGTRNYRIDLDKIEYQLTQGLKIGMLKNGRKT